MQVPSADPRESRARPRLLPFLALTVQLVLLLLVFRYYRVEEPAFFLLSLIAFAGFLVHFWLPFRLKEWFLIAVSLGGAYLLLEPTVASGLFVGGLILYSIVASPIAFRLKVGLVAAVFALALYLRVRDGWGIPGQLWPLFGAIFMFRIIVYLYDLSHQKGRPSLREFLSYFYMLPNYYFLLFPVVDFTTMRKSYYQRDIHEVAQQGVQWIVRGTVHLLLYRIVVDLRGVVSPETVTSSTRLAMAAVLTYLLYLRVSGHFHIIVGMLHLFGFDLPETNRKYLLARSLADFWRRINIYWKDFMVKVVYFPIYFRLRKKNEVRAQILATAAVFFTTWALHVYQYFWLRGTLLFTGPDIAFWSVLGLLVIVNLFFEMGSKKSRRKAIAPHPLRNALQVAGTFLLIVTLWSMWNTHSFAEWFDLITWWKAG
jgi:D-alanyl-lipoteichoic acid acyltransferase DltB (MBOAT superfamily)